MVRTGDPDGLSFTRISLSTTLDKKNYLKRLRQERQYGRLLADHARTTQPDIILSGNTPLDAQLQLLNAARQKGVPFIFWLQDLLGLAAGEVLSKQLWLIGRAIGRYYERMEARQLRQSKRIVAISDHFTPVLQSYGVAVDRLVVQENWADISEIRPGERDNAWSQAQQLGSGVRFIYAGNLGKKQNPSLLLDLARSVGDKGAEVVVISQGAVANHVRATALREGIANLRLLPFQPSADLPSVLASADVLVALLDASAGRYCVPSKILTYLAAGRPILASLPRENPAFRLIQETESGLAVDTGSTLQFSDQARLLARDPRVRQQLSTAARSAAEARFDMKSITDHFEDVLLGSR